MIMSYGDVLNYLIMGLTIAAPTVLGFVAAWLLFQLQERHKQSFAADSARQSLIAELKWLESMLSIAVVKCAVQSDIIARGIQEYRWFLKEGLERISLEEIPSEIFENRDKLKDDEITQLLPFFHQEGHAIELPVTITSSILATPTTAKLSAEEIKKLIDVRWQATMLAYQVRLMNEYLRLTFTVIDGTNHQIVKKNHAASLHMYGRRACSVLDRVRAALTELEKPPTRKRMRIVAEPLKKLFNAISIKRLSFTLVAIGLGLTIAGWYLDRVAERYEWVGRFLAPNYGTTLRAYEKMLVSAADVQKSGTPIALTKNEPAFQNVLSILRQHIPGIGSANVEKMRIKDVGFGAGYNTQTGIPFSGAQPHFEVQLADGKILTKYLNDIRPEIQKRFLEDTLFMWSSVIFWTGIVVSLSSALIRN
jgi:hypothetical protein